MQSILEELWYGNICPNEGCRKTTPEVKELMGYIADHHEALLGMLTDKQKEQHGENLYATLCPFCPYCPGDIVLTMIIASLISCIVLFYRSVSRLFTQINTKP